MGFDTKATTHNPQYPNFKFPEKPGLLMEMLKGIGNVMFSDFDPKYAQPLEPDKKEKK